MRSERGAARERVSWDSALDHAAGRFAEIIRTHGPDAVGFYISGQLLTEDYYVFNKLAKGLIGTNNVDTNSRLCMSSAVTGYKTTLGADAPPACYDDIAATDCLFIAGSNTAYAHPVVYRRIEDARKENPNLKVIVVDPRRTDTAREADLHLPILPGTDVALFNAMLHVMLWENMADTDYIAAHTSGFEALRATVREYSPEAVSRAVRRAGSGHHHRRALVRAIACHAVAVLPRFEPVQPRYRQECSPDQPASCHRPDRPPRRRAIFANRSAQRDGRTRSRRHGEFAVRASRSG